eukprot:TRINITY_DN8348_c0_g1_i1.p1 TRINITY_DN8348_c0_g1~~TRINITY_DN8348_c0_g1_i1.p1  ORF type:complete len:463 (+),score=146.04 TRINITY_DN8348_c0_g1_i1:49-1389(+)
MITASPFPAEVPLEVDDEYVRALFSGDVGAVLARRGFAVVRFTEAEGAALRALRGGCRAFFGAAKAVKAAHRGHVHGYRAYEDVKEQYEVRLAAAGVAMNYPGGAGEAPVGPETDGGGGGSDDRGVVHGGGDVGGERECEDSGVGGGEAEARAGLRAFTRDACRAFAVLDGRARSMLHEVMAAHGERAHESLLDPPAAPSRIGEDGYDTSLPPRYISSSVLDIFYYLNAAAGRPHEKLVESTVPVWADSGNVVYRNHLDHVDSGLVTVVPVTTVPALEVFCQERLHWVQVEKVVTEWVVERGAASRGALRDEGSETTGAGDGDAKAGVGEEAAEAEGARAAEVGAVAETEAEVGEETEAEVGEETEAECYGIVMIGKTLQEALGERVLACQHRVASSLVDRSRLSTVYKLRSRPMFTGARYETDYPIALEQQHGCPITEHAHWLDE